ncbi:MAG: hypothetical protein ACYT04_40770, partial [Nostoc sp.]
WELEDMQRLVRFIFGFGFSCFITWGAIGDYLHVINNSNRTYSDIKQAIAQYQKLPEDSKNMTVLWGIAGAGLAAYALQGGKR